MARGDLVWMGMSKRYEKVRCHVKNSLGVGLIAVLLVNLIVVDRVRGAWKQDWDKIVAAAEKEGEVTIYGQSRAGVGRAILAFKDPIPRSRSISSADREATWRKRLWPRKGRTSISST